MTNRGAADGTSHALSETRHRPVLGSLQGYRRAWLRPDVIAGLTVWAVLVPESLAYASIAGLPPVVGLYAAAPALILYALLGSSRHLIVGPRSATAALSAAIIAPIAGGDTGRYVALSTAGNFFQQAWGVITHVGETHVLSLLIGLASLIMVLAIKRWLPLIPGSLLAVVLGILAVDLLGLDEEGVKIVGQVTRGGLPSAFPWGWDGATT